MFAAREMAILLSACLLASASGCTPAGRWAEVARDRIAPGMADDQVRDEIGDPAQIVQGETGQPFFWIYRYESGPSTVAVIFLVILFVGVVVLILAAASKGGGGGLNVGGGGGSDDDLAEFQVHFNGKGVVSGITPIIIRRRE